MEHEKCIERIGNKIVKGDFHEALIFWKLKELVMQIHLLSMIIIKLLPPYLFFWFYKNYYIKLELFLLY